MSTYMRERHPLAMRMSCDSLVALPGATAEGVVLFAKNSDRPALEPQPLVHVPRREHPAGATVRCTYVTIPQTARTAQVIGSRPYWCWGFEHGLNEHGVAIGNHSVFTRDGLSGLGLIGMDLVRLGLERGRTAEEAVDTITALLAAHGQGGSGYADKEWPYHNSFLVADRRAAFVLETSDRHWAVRHVADVASMSNHVSIADDWDALSDGAIEHAIAEGWWPADADRRFDFAAAYRDTALVPEVVSSGRHQRTCALLAAAQGALRVDALKAALRDHYGRVGPPHDVTPGEAQYFSVCMHADPVGTTAASIIARLPAAADEAPVYWASLGSPCIGAFIPLFVDAAVPPLLARGGEQPDAASPWWQANRLLSLVERDWDRHAPRVRTRFDALETEWDARLPALTGRSAADRSAFSAAAVEGYLAALRALTVELTGG